MPKLLNQKLVSREEWFTWLPDFQNEVRACTKKRDYPGVARALANMDPEVLPAESEWNGPYVIEAREFYHAQLLQIIRGAGAKVGPEVLKVYQQEISAAPTCPKCNAERVPCSYCSNTGRTDSKGTLGSIFYLKHLSKWLEHHISN